MHLKLSALNETYAKLYIARQVPVGHAQKGERGIIFLKTDILLEYHHNIFVLAKATLHFGITSLLGN